MYLGYNTNGFAHHDLFDAVELLAEIGYRGVAVTIDHNALPPGEPDAPTKIKRLRGFLEERGMRSVIETGARYLLDPRVKHEPTLLSDDRRRRIDFYRYAIDCAAELGSDCVSIWSGALHGNGAQPPSAVQDRQKRPRAAVLQGEQWPGAAVQQRERAMDRLIDGLGEVLDYAARRGVPVGFEPEPGMLIDTLAAFEELAGRIGRDDLRLTLDVGHLHCQGETPIDEHVRRWASRLVNVHLEDMRAGVHEHLMFGEGEIDFSPVLGALAASGYSGGVYVELSRHGREAPDAARKAFEFLGQFPFASREA